MKSVENMLTQVTHPTKVLVHHLVTHQNKYRGVLITSVINKYPYNTPKCEPLLFVGSGTMLLAGLNNGASRVIGIDVDARYLKTARKRIVSG